MVGIGVKWEDGWEKYRKRTMNGIITALATPFDQGELDKASFKRLLQFQIDQGVDGFVINGTTAESPCLSQEEVESLFQWTREEGKEGKEGKKKPLVLGVGGNCTKKTVTNIKIAEKLQADAVLAVVPYYNKPPQRGLVKHFNIVAESSSLPVILYNVPSRTGVGLSLESIVELSRHTNIIGIKEASGDKEMGRGIVENTDNDFTLLSGDDDTCLDLCALGAKGVVSVVSHVIGREMKKLFWRVKQSRGDELTDVLKEYKEKYAGLLQVVYSESNPIGIKMALKLLGVFNSAELRSPLVSLETRGIQQLGQELQKIGFTYTDPV